MRKTIIPAIAITLITCSAVAATNKTKHSQDYLLGKKIKRVNWKTNELQREINNLQHQVSYLKRHQPAKMQIYDTSKKAKSSKVAPYLHRIDIYDNSELIVMLPSINEDLALLEQRQRLLHKIGQEDFPQFPFFLLSGYLEAQSYWQHSYTGGGKVDLDLTGAELDLVTDIASWATGFMAVSYDKYANGYGAGTRKVDNGKLYLNRAFFTIGNLDKFPIYASFGQVNVPFGKYSHHSISSPLVNPVGKTKARALSVGFKHNNIYGVVYGFKGDSYEGNGYTLHQWGANLGFKPQLGKYHGHYGVSYIANIADSNGMQETSGGSNWFKGFADSYGSEQLQHTIPGVNAYAISSFGPFSLIAEFVGTTRAFDAQDLAFNSKGARVSAATIEGAYDFYVYHKKITAALNYSHSWEALGLNIAEQAFIAALEMNPWQHVAMALEWRHDINYPMTDSTQDMSNNTVYPSGRRDQDAVKVKFELNF